MNADKKRSVFSDNPTQALGLLMENRNALTIISNIIVKKWFNFFNNVGDLKEDECFFSVKNIKTKPKMTESQMKTALKNLVHYGFIEILEFTPPFRVTGLKKIRILVNPFDKITAEIVKKNDDCSLFI